MTSNCDSFLFGQNDDNLGFHPHKSGSVIHQILSDESALEEWASRVAMMRQQDAKEPKRSPKE